MKLICCEKIGEFYTENNHTFNNSARELNTLMHLNTVINFEEV